MNLSYLMKDRYIPLILLTFILSRIIFYSIGIEIPKIGEGMHFIDFELLKSNLMESLYYLHAQPPLYNFLLGIVLKFFPNDISLIFYFLYKVMSLTIYILMYKIFKNYKFPSLFAFVFSTIFILFPEAILYENIFLIDWLIAGLLVISVYFFQKYQTTFELKYALYFIILLTAISLTRSIFHFLFIAGSIVILILVKKQNWKRILLYTLIPIILVLGLYTKNYMLFNTFGASSWLGSNMWRIGYYTVSVTEGKDENKTNQKLQNLFEDKIVSEAALHHSFDPIDIYNPKYYQVPEKFSSIPQVNQKYKKSGGTNFNYYGYINISKDLKHDFVNIVKMYPKDYIKTVLIAWQIYAKPSWDYSVPILNNYSKIKPYVNIITFQELRSYVEEEILGVQSKFQYPNSNFLLIPLSLFIIIILLFSEIIKFIRTGKADFTILFMGFTIFYIAILGNAIEIGEGHRFRVPTGPFTYILVLLAFQKIVQRIKCS